MAGTNKTFKDLQDYAVNPPPGLFGKLWKKIRRLKPGDIDPADVAALPEKNDIPDESNLTDEKILSRLQNYSSEENTVPPFDHRKILQAISNPEKKTYTLFYRIAAAAAIAGILFFAYYSTNDRAGNSGSIADTIHNKSNQAQETANSIDHRTGRTTKQEADKTTGPHEKRVSIGASHTDFIYQFTNFTYDEAKVFLDNLTKNKKVLLDNYSYINISDKMEGFLKDMYAQNRRDKPTRKARRLKSKLIKWKKKDESYFDKGAAKNPLDIIDLSEFILK